jgi:signal transduction histidine kinase
MLRTSLSLRTRVTLAAALAATLGVVGAGVSGTVARHMVEKNENARLAEVAIDFSDEIEEELAETPDDDTPAERRHFRELHGARTPTNIVTHELEALHYHRPKALVRPFNEEKFGYLDLPMPALGTCDTDPLDDLRSCTVRFKENGTLTLSVNTKKESSRMEIFRLAMLLGALVSAIAGALASFFLARWTLLPLGDLRKRVRQVNPQKPSDEVFAGTTQYPTEVEELREAVAALVRRLALALDQAQTFATRAAHELRTPLASLSAELELLLEEQADPLPLRRMKDRLDHLTNLIQRLLTLASTSDQIKHTGETIELGDVAETVLESLSAADRKRVQLHQTEEVYVRGDAGLLCSMLANGLLNALKFSESDVQLLILGNENTGHFEIRDSGRGLSEEEKNNAFLPYYRSTRARKNGVPGYGIGLALIAHVAEVHGGKAYFAPSGSSQTGATLKIELPTWRKISPDS